MKLVLLPPLISTTFIFFLAIVNLRHFSANAGACHPDDEAGLLAFKSGIKSDPSGLLKTWKAGTDCCNTWSGISCQDQIRVTTISIYGRTGQLNSSLSGTISPYLSKLQYLTGIYIENHPNLKGSFPNFFLNLPRLGYVYLENNGLSGRIPENIGNLTQLVAFSLQGNKFSGPIPSSIGQLTQLIQLKLGSNRLTGTIPSTIGQIKNLTYLNLERNQLTGGLPGRFAGFTDMRFLSLSHNKLTGKIPGSISSLAPLLINLELGHNNLTGQIPDFLGKFRTLDTLDLSWNQFSGVVPKTFANLTKIFNLDLSHNNLVDPFPVMNVKGIESLDLSYNHFNLGNIPSWVTSSTIIYSLKLAKCGLKFKLDDWKPKETYFYDYIDLSENQITGSPVKLLNRTDFLVGFYASGNKLKFNFESLRIVQKLKELNLSRNLV